VSAANGAHGPALRVLVVEDEAHLACGLKLNLELEGFEAVIAGSGREAAAHLLGPAFDAILLDVQLPDVSGFELCQRLRDGGDHTPVIMLTVRAAAEDRVRGLEVGADDYVPKPFAMAELLARLRAVLRRQSWERAQAQTAPAEVVRFGQAEIDFTSHRASSAGAPVALTKLELDLVRYFTAHPGRVLSRAELLEKVWKLAHFPNTRTVDNFIVRLRRHFEPNPDRPRYFVSVRGAGYKFVPDRGLLD
jgi:DNA-binding response OmpR family regulator